MRARAVAAEHAGVGSSLDEQRLRDDLPAVVTVTGRSMEPGLPTGTRVRVVALDAPPRPGDVLLLRSPAGQVLHRALWIDPRQGLLFHRGDNGGRVGLTAPAAVLGRAVAVLDGARGLALSALTRAQQRAFVRAQRRCKLYAALRSRATALRLGRGPLGELARRLLLRA